MCKHAKKDTAHNLLRKGSLQQHNSKMGKIAPLAWIYAARSGIVRAEGNPRISADGQAGGGIEKVEVAHIHVQHEA